MSSNVVPLALRPYLVSFLMKEMKGYGKIFAGYKYKTVDIKPYSFVGKFLLEHLEKLDYPIKDLSRFTIFLDIKASSRKRYVASGKFWKIESLGKTHVYLPEEFVETINQIFEQQFRVAFFHYVDARVENDITVTAAILSFIDKYDLFEVNITQIQLRKLYYRMKSEGLCFSLQNKIRRK